MGLGCGIASALMTSAGESGSIVGVLLANFSMLPLIMVGLALGTRSALLSALSGVFMVIILTNPFSGGIYAISIAVPCWYVARYGLMNRKNTSSDPEWYPIGRILAKLTGYGAMVLVLAAIADLGSEDGLRGTIERLLDNIFSEHVAISGDLDQTALLEPIVSFFPGIMVVVWLVVLSVNTVLAQAILTWKGIEVRPTPYYSHIKAPEWLYWALVGAGIIALLGTGNFQYLGRNLTIVFAAPFFYIGLSIIHVMFRRLPLPNLALTAFYILVVTFGWSVIAVAGLGYFEQWTELRKRYVGPQDNSEEE